MDKEKQAVNTTDPAAGQKTEPVAPVTPSDAEARLAVLAAEKAKAIEEAANWKIAALKAKSKNKEGIIDDEEAEKERIASVVQEELAKARISAIDTERETLLKKTLQENKELKLAQLNKSNMPPASVGAHSEGQSVQDTSVTTEQLSAFKARGWSDKDIERYKKNLRRYATR